MADDKLPKNADISQPTYEERYEQDTLANLIYTWPTGAGAHVLADMIIAAGWTRAISAQAPGMKAMRTIPLRLFKAAEAINRAAVERAKVRANPDPLYRDHMYGDAREHDEAWQEYYEDAALQAAERVKA